MYIFDVRYFGDMLCKWYIEHIQYIFYIKTENKKTKKTCIFIYHVYKLVAFIFYSHQMEKKPENMEIRDAVFTTDKDRTKTVEYGKRKFTAIDAYHQIKTATELRGPYGKHRGLRDVTITYADASGITYVTLLGEFYYPAIGEVGKFPIANNIKMGDDAIKKLMTNSISKALSYIGFNADVFLWAFDDDVAKHNEKHGKPTTPPAPVAPAPVEPGPKNSHVSGEVIDRDMASMSKTKYNCYLTPAEQEVAFLEYKGLQGKELVEALKLRLSSPTQSPTQATPSPTPPVVAETPPPTAVPTATTPTETARVEEGLPPTEQMPREIAK